MQLEPFVKLVGRVVEPLFNRRFSAVVRTTHLHGLPAGVSLQHPNLEPDFQALEAQAVAQLLVGVSLQENSLEHLDRPALYLRRLLCEFKLSLEVANL